MCQRDRTHEEVSIQRIGKSNFSPSNVQQSLRIYHWMKRYQRSNQTGYLWLQRELKVTHLTPTPAHPLTDKAVWTQADKKEHCPCATHNLRQLTWLVRSTNVTKLYKNRKDPNPLKILQESGLTKSETHRMASVADQADHLAQQTRKILVCEFAKT